MVCCGSKMSETWSQENNFITHEFTPGYPSLCKALKLQFPTFCFCSSCIVCIHQILTSPFVFPSASNLYSAAHANYGSAAIHVHCVDRKCPGPTDAQSWFFQRLNVPNNVSTNQPFAMTGADAHNTQHVNLQCNEVPLQFIAIIWRH